jgi:hypothetical protein
MSFDDSVTENVRHDGGKLALCAMCIDAGRGIALAKESLT